MEKKEKKKRETDCRHCYRVWDEKEKRYGLTPYTMPLQGYETRLVPPASSDPERFKIEQCTGLKDMKGEKIFENDILMLSKEHNNMLVKVVWLSHFCQYRLVSLRGPCVLFFSKILADNSKVVGNTHKLEFKTVAEAREEERNNSKKEDKDAEKEDQ